MKEVKNFILADIVVLLLKVVAGFVCHSYTFLATGILDLLLILFSLFVYKRKENRKWKGIISSLLGFVVILGVIGFNMYVFQAKIWKPSLWILLFMVLALLARYLIGCFYTNIHYQQKKGLLSYGNLHSTLDFVLYGIILATLVFGKVSKWVSVFRYADRVGVILISLIIIYKSFKLIKNSFGFMEEEELTKVVEEEIVNRSEVKKIERILLNSFGGIKHITIDIVLNGGISMIDINSFVISLQDYLLKFGDVVDINLVNPTEKKKRKTKPKVRSLKQDARNSGSGNSKTSTKKKNTKKKNKKR